MMTVVRQIWRFLKWPVIVAVIVWLFVEWFVPFAKWLFVDKTMEVYGEVEDRYSTDGDPSVTYQGFIIDTIIQQSNTKKGKVDTVVHRQSIVMEPHHDNKTDGKPKIGDVGTFGDGAGMLNAFFSFLAFVAVLVTIYLQSRKDDNDKRNGARVQFEQEFFAMVGMLEDIVSHLRFTDTEIGKTAAIPDEVAKNYGYQSDVNGTTPTNTNQQTVIEGRDVFRYIYEGRGELSLLSYVNKEDGSYQSEEAQNMCFDGTLDHYFRYLYRILKHIDESELLTMLDKPKVEREKYAHLLRAQLSNYELLMWFYNGLLGENPGTIKKLIERYAMFNNLRAWKLGKHQCEYYQEIFDEELYEDPKGYDAKTTYSVKAFWDEKTLKDLKKKAKQNKKTTSSISRFFDCFKNTVTKKQKDNDTAPHQTLSTSTIETVDGGVGKQKDSNPKKEENTNAGKPKTKENKRNKKPTKEENRSKSNRNKLMDLIEQHGGEKWSNKAK